MTVLRPRRAPVTRFGPVLGFGLAVVLITGACDPASPRSTASGAVASVASVEASLGSGASPDTSAPLQAGQSDTDWGRIWDSLPAAFPVYPGATPAGEAATGPVSATFALDGTDARTVAAWMQAELERAAYQTEGLNGPLEDGSFVLESVGDGDCQIQVAVAPLGGLTTVSVRYGAACPSP